MTGPREEILDPSDWRWPDPEFPESLRPSLEWRCSTLGSQAPKAKVKNWNLKHSPSVLWDANKREQFISSVDRWLHLNLTCVVGFFSHTAGAFDVLKLIVANSGVFGVSGMGANVEAVLGVATALSF